MDKNERDNIKREITERFVIALDYLVDSGKMENIKDFERITGIRAQRITGMRKFLKDGDPEKPYYTNADHIAILNSFFGVSFDFIFKGQKPIVLKEERKQGEVNDTSPPVYQNQKIMQLEEVVELLERKVQLLNERFQFHLEKTT